MAEPTLDLVRELFVQLRGAELDVFLMGGWAEELRGLVEPRPHRDIDLLLRAGNLDALDAFLEHHPEFTEIPAKRFSHKRAALFEEVMVEFILVRERQTVFFEGLFTLDWPSDTFDEPLPLPVEMFAISAAALRFYRSRHEAIQAAYEEFTRPKPGY